MRALVRLSSCWVAGLAVLAAVPAVAAEFTARDVTAIFFRTPHGAVPNLARRDLSYLDLSELDFKSARLFDVDLYGADLTSANLRGTDLAGARLDRATVIAADFSGANLERATILKPSAFRTMRFDRADAPRFAGANLRFTRIAAHMEGVDFRNADLSHARIGPTTLKADAWAVPSSVLKGCDFSGARMIGSEFRYADLTFARFAGADLHDALFLGANLSMADFSGADLTGADFTGADLDNANLSGVKGLATVRGLAHVKNWDRVRR